MKPFYKSKENNTLFDIAGVIGMTSSVFNGTIALCFPKEVYLKIINSMLGENYTEIDDEVADGAAELMNIIYGSAKTMLTDQGYKVEKAIPTVIKGEKIMTTHLTKSPVIVLPFELEGGVFHIEISTEDRQSL